MSGNIAGRGPATISNRAGGIAGKRVRTSPEAAMVIFARRMDFALASVSLEGSPR
jgi:hypothetical protein